MSEPLFFVENNRRFLCSIFVLTFVQKSAIIWKTKPTVTESVIISGECIKPDEMSSPDIKSLCGTMGWGKKSMRNHSKNAAIYIVIAHYCVDGIFSAEM